MAAIKKYITFTFFSTIVRAMDVSALASLQYFFFFFFFFFHPCYVSVGFTSLCAVHLLCLISTCPFPIIYSLSLRWLILSIITSNFILNLPLLMFSYTLISSICLTFFFFAIWNACPNHFNYLFTITSDKFVFSILLLSYPFILYFSLLGFSKSLLRYFISTAINFLWCLALQYNVHYNDLILSCDCIHLLTLMNFELLFFHNRTCIWYYNEVDIWKIEEIKGKRIKVI